MSDENQFLFTELIERYKYWQHLDKRIDNSITTFIGFISLIIPIIFFTFDKTDDITLKYICLSFLLTIVFLAGYLLLNRIYYADLSKSKTMFAINLIKQYFVDKNLDIKNYMYYDIYKPFEDKSEKDKQIKVNFHYFLTFSVTLINSFIVGILILILQNWHSKYLELSQLNLCFPMIFSLITLIISVGIYFYLFNNYKLDK